MKVNVFDFDCHVDFLIVRLGPDLSSSLSLLGNAEFGIDFEDMLRRVFRREKPLDKKDALSLASALLKDTSEFCYFMNLCSKKSSRAVRRHQPVELAE